MAKVFRTYCPCKRLNEEVKNWCTVCGKLFKINNDFNDEAGRFCSCVQPIFKEVTSTCVLCGRSLQFYATPNMDFLHTIFCNCVALTRSVNGNICEVCDKPKITDKKILFCYCYRPTKLNGTGECVACGKPKYVRLENENNRCFCTHKTKTDQQEACLDCGNRKVDNGAPRYCYMKDNKTIPNETGCPLAENPRRLPLFDSNAVCCPLREINLCPWIGNILEIAAHCERDHTLNFFKGDASVLCRAHLEDYTEFDYYSTEFLIHTTTYEKLFKCSFEINWKRMMKWSVAFLNGPDEDLNENPHKTYRFYVEFLNSKRDHMILDAYCTKENSPSRFAEFVTTAEIQKDHLLPFHERDGSIFYRIFIVEIPKRPLAMMANYAEQCKGHFMVDWLEAKLPERVVYDDNCRCVKIRKNNLS